MKRIGVIGEGVMLGIVMGIVQPGNTPKSNDTKDLPRNNTWVRSPLYIGLGAGHHLIRVD